MFDAPRFRGSSRAHSGHAAHTCRQQRRRKPPSGGGRGRVRGPALESGPSLFPPASFRRLPQHEFVPLEATGPGTSTGPPGRGHGAPLAKAIDAIGLTAASSGPQMYLRLAASLSFRVHKCASSRESLVRKRLQHPTPPGYLASSLLAACHHRVTPMPCPLPDNKQNFPWNLFFFR